MEFTDKEGTKYEIQFTDLEECSLEIVREEEGRFSTLSVSLGGEEARLAYYYLNLFPQEEWSRIIQEQLTNNRGDHFFVKSMMIDVHREIFKKSFNK